MKFGLYSIPSSSLTFRKMDGEWAAVEDLISGDSKEMWKHYSTEKGKPVDGQRIETDEGLNCITYCRAIAKVMFGVPDSVDLYSEDAKGIQFNQKTYVAEYNKQNYARVSLLIPPEIKAEWKEKAKAERLSLTSWIIKKTSE